MSLNRNQYISLLFLKGRIKKLPIIGKFVIFTWWRLKKIVYPILYLLGYYPFKLTCSPESYSPVERIDLIPEIIINKRAPTTPGQSCLGSEIDYYTENFKRLFQELIEPPGKMERKSWEFVKVIEGLANFGTLHSQSRGLGVGSGCEKPLYYFSRHCKEIVGIDLYASDHPDWVHTANSDILANPSKYAPFSYPKERLVLRHMDATQMSLPNNSFDFVFSFSAIEHFGSRDNIRKTMHEIQRVLKPNGVAAITTELIITKGASHHEYFTLPELNEVMIQTPGLQLIGDLNLALNESDLAHVIDLQKNVATDVSIIFKHGSMAFTPVVLFLRKAPKNV